MQETAIYGIVEKTKASKVGFNKDCYTCFKSKWRFNAKKSFSCLIYMGFIQGV